MARTRSTLQDPPVRTAVAPVETPPQPQAEQTDAFFEDRRIDGLWALDEVRNAWARVDGIGWKKIANVNDSSFTALSVLAAHAKQTGCRVDLRDTADSMIHEMYVF